MTAKAAKNTMTAIKKTRSHEIDMTRGALLPKILLFTLPVIGSSLLQLLFNTVDMIVVGRFEGDAALGAVGTTASLVNLINALFIGLSTGSGACVSVAIGARHDDDTADLVHTAMTTALISGGILAVVGYLGAPLFLSFMNIDESLIGMSITYLRIYFLGAPFIMLYNFGFSIMRTLGDTRRPLFYMLYAGIANVGFNLLFVLVLNMGVAGVALGTVISFAISASLILSSLCRYDNACRLIPRRLRIRPSCLFEIMRIGIPAGFRARPRGDLGQCRRRTARIPPLCDRGGLRPDDHLLCGTELRSRALSPPSPRALYLHRSFLCGGRGLWRLLYPFA